MVEGATEGQVKARQRRVHLAPAHRDFPHVDADAEDPADVDNRMGVSGQTPGCRS